MPEGLPSGIFPPIPTPFDATGEIAADALRGNLKRWAGAPLAGCVVLGSNGESVHLDDAETLLVLETARDGIPADRWMLAGVGRASTRETIAWCRRAGDLGADAALLLPPSYYRGAMTPAALQAHYRAAADASPIPVVLYNMPACTGLDLDAETVIALSAHENIIGLKDSGGDVTKLGEIRQYADGEFAVLAGSAGFLLPALAVGASGGILALANIAPGPCTGIYDAARRGDWDAARAIQLRLIRANTAVTRGWGVPALKAAMEMVGLFGGAPRAPLAPLSDGRREELRRILAEAGILEDRWEETTER